MDFVVLSKLFNFRKIIQMKNLIIIRHAKSSWDVPVTDKEREIVKSGVESIKKVAQEAKSIILEAFVIWSSTATRAMQTANVFCTELNIDITKIVLKDNLYTFDANELFSIIKNCDNNIDNLIVFGHNSAITDFVNHCGDKTFFDVPTAGLVNILFNGDNWSEIKTGKTRINIFPKEI